MYSSSTSPFVLAEFELEEDEDAQGEPELLEAWSDVLRANYPPNPGRIGCVDKALMKRLVLDPVDFRQENRSVQALKHLNQCGRCADEVVAIGLEEGCPGPADRPGQGEELYLPAWKNGFVLRQEINERRKMVPLRIRTILLLRRSGRTWSYVSRLLRLPVSYLRMMVELRFEEIHMHVPGIKKSRRSQAA